MQSRNSMHVGRGRTDHFGPAGSARCRATNLLILTLNVRILPGITGLESILHVAHAEHVSFWYPEQAQVEFSVRSIWAGARQCRLLILSPNPLYYWLPKDLENGLWLPATCQRHCQASSGGIAWKWLTLSPAASYFTNFSNAVGLPRRNGFLHSNHFFRAPDSRAVRSLH